MPEEEIIIPEPIETVKAVGDTIETTIAEHKDYLLAEKVRVEGKIASGIATVTAAYKPKLNELNEKIAQLE